MSARTVEGPGVNPPSWVLGEKWKKGSGSGSLESDRVEGEKTRTTKEDLENRFGFIERQGDTEILPNLLFSVLR